MNYLQDLCSHSTWSWNISAWRDISSPRRRLLSFAKRMVISVKTTSDVKKYHAPILHQLALAHCLRQAVCLEMRIDTDVMKGTKVYRYISSCVHSEL